LERFQNEQIGIANRQMQMRRTGVQPGAPGRGHWDHNREENPLTPALSPSEGEREKFILWAGTRTRGGARSSLAPGYYLTPRWGCFLARCAR